MQPCYKIYSATIALLLFWFSSSAQNFNGTWSITGPVAFPTFISDQINGMGRVVQLKFNATDSLKMYAVSASGGLWITADGGISWKKTGTDNQLPATQCSAVCIDSLNPNIIYLSTGDPNYYFDSYGMFKSIDGGVTWSPSGTGLDNHMAVEILMDPANENTLVAATSAGIYRTIDAGANWTVVKAGGQFNDMAFKPGSGTIMYATDTASFWRSTNTGLTWTQIVSVNPAIGNGGKIAVSAASPNTVYVGYVGSNSITDGVGKGGVIYRSTNSGQSFTLRKGDVTPNLGSYASGGQAPGQGRYNWTFFADRANANILYVGSHVVWKSTNAGTTWTELTNWFDKCHTDMHHIVSSPFNNNKLFNANDGGIFLSTDAGVNWAPFCEGLSATEVYHLGQSNLSKNLADVSTQDNGEIYFKTNTWYTNRGGDLTTSLTFDYRTENTVYYIDAGQRRDLQTTAGSTINTLGLIGTTDNDKYAFTSLNQNVAFVSQGAVILRTTTLNKTLPKWKKLKTFKSNIKAIAISPTNTDELYVVLDNKKVYYSSDAFSALKPTFVAKKSAPVETNLYSNIVVNKNNTNIVYLTCGSQVFRSADKAATWQNISGTLPPVNIIDLVHDVNSSNESFYVGSGIGVYYRNNTMTDWQSFSKGLPAVALITNLKAYWQGTNSLLRVSFYGRGVWETPIFGTCTDVNLSLTFDNYPQETSWDIKDADNNVVASSYGTYNTTAQGSTIDIPLCLVAGCYKFTIYDAFGDGMCCDYGNGSYTLTTGTNTIKTGGSFGSSESTDFCLPFNGLQKPSNSTGIPVTKSKPIGKENSVTIIPNPASQNANIIISSNINTQALMQVVDEGGKIIMFRKQDLTKGSNTVSLQLNNFSPGIYFVAVRIGEELITKKLSVIK